MRTLNVQVKSRIFKNLFALQTLGLLCFFILVWANRDPWWKLSSYDIIIRLGLALLTLASSFYLLIRRPTLIWVGWTLLFMGWVPLIILSAKAHPRVFWLSALFVCPIFFYWLVWNFRIFNLACFRKASHWLQEKPDEIPHVQAEWFPSSSQKVPLSLVLFDPYSAQVKCETGFSFHGNGHLSLRLGSHSLRVPAEVLGISHHGTVISLYFDLNRFEDQKEVLDFFNYLEGTGYGSTSNFWSPFIN